MGPEELTISVPAFGPPVSAGEAYVNITQPPPPPIAPESNLLKSIRQALSATTPIPYESPRRTLSAGPDGEEELFWLDRTVIWSVGDIQRRKWVFDTEAKDQVLWACWASFPSDKFSTNAGPSTKLLALLASAQRQAHTATPTSDEDYIATFGKYSGIRPPTSHEASFAKSLAMNKKRQTTTRCICVFLTSFVMIYTKDGGIEYTAHLPFHVRRAWELATGGVLIERVVASDEVDGDLLTTMFTLTGPYEEVKMPGFAHSIQGGFISKRPGTHVGGSSSSSPDFDPIVINKDMPGDPDHPMEESPRTFTKTERVIFSSSEPDPVCNRILVTHDPATHMVRVWRYVQEKSDGLPTTANSSHPTRPPPQPRTHSLPNPPDSDRSTAAASIPQADRVDVPLTPTQDTIAASLALAKQTAQPSGQGGPSPMTGATTRAPSTTHVRALSHTRNELSITMDRMALNGSGEEPQVHGVGAPVVEDEPIQPEFWFACIAEISTKNDESLGSDGDVQACLFDVRLTTGKLAVLVPSKKMIIALSIAYTNGNIVTKQVQTIPAIAMAPVAALRGNVNDLLIIRPDRTLSIITYDWKQIRIRLAVSSAEIDMYDDPLDPEAPHTLRPPNPPIRLQDPVFSSVTVVYEDSTKARITVDLDPCAIVNRVFGTLSYVLPPDITFDIRKRFLRRWLNTKKSAVLSEQFHCCGEAIMEALCVGLSEPGEVQRTGSINFSPSAWSRLATSTPHTNLSIDTALRHLELPTEPEFHHGMTRVRLPRRINNPPKWASAAMQGLHLLGESTKIYGKPHELRMLAPLLVRIGRFTGMDWSNHWAVLAPSDVDAWAPANAYGFAKDPRLPHRPQDVLQYLLTRLHNTHPTKSGHFISIAQIHQVYGIRPSMEYGAFHVNSVSRTVLDAYMALTDFKTLPNPRDRAKACVQVIHHNGCSADVINQLPFGVAAPLKEAMKLCQEWPPMDWEPSLYILIDRFDLAKMANMNWERSVSGFGEAYRYKQEAVFKDERETVGTVVQQAKMSADGSAPPDLEASMANREFTDVRFGVDRRLREVDRMLQSTSTTTVRILDRPDMNEHDLAKEQHQFAVIIAERTLSLSLGRAMYSYGSLQTVDSDSFTIPKIDLSVRMVPQGVTITIDQAKMIPSESRIWGEFHNGVAAALRIARGAVGVDSTWIAFNRPNDLTSQHAGFILGLGLNGHLEGMYTWHTFSYLTPKHEMTTVAMLLGLAASYVGRGDLMVTKMLTVHTPALLPPGAAEMNLGLATQMSGLMGIGVLYLGRKDRRMAEACLGEIGGRDFGSRLDVTNENREAYAVTAALAFGLIMCGHGGTATSPADLDMVAKLRVLVHGPSGTAESEQFQPVFGVNITFPAASIALGLMFMKTERVDVAGLFEMAHTPLALSRVPPNVLLVRSLSRLLIMWETILPTVAWVTTQVPKKMAENEELQGYDDAVKDSYDLAYYNIVAGVCFAIALKYAGSADQQAETVLIHYYDAFSKTASQPAQTFDAQIKRSAVRDSLNLISLCVGTVMSGTGELNALRRLRYAHGQLMPYVKYGSHMTSHMALGLLFLGGGRHTIGTSNAAIACLVAAFYPRWPNGSSDTKGLLPVFRHLWTLAVEPRCLIARDADSGETVYIPVKIRLKENGVVKTYQYTSPSLIPDFNNLVNITVDTPRYWPFWIDFDGPHATRFASNVLRYQTIWVKRRSGYLGYGEDPRGNRSIFAFTGFRVGDTATMDFPRGSLGERKPVMMELNGFITSLSVDTRTISFADRLCREEPASTMEAMVLSYCQQSLLECLLHDKPATLKTLLGIFQIRYGTSGDSMMGSGLPLFTLKNLKLLNTYYAHLHNRNFGGRIGKDRALRPPLIRLTLLQAAINVMDDYSQHLREDDDFKDLFAAFVRGEDCRGLLQNQEPDSKAAFALQLAFYIVNEHVPGVEIISTFGEVIKEPAVQSKIKEAVAGDVEEGKLAKAGRLLARSVLQAANATQVWEMSSRALDDIVEAKGF